MLLISKYNPVGNFSLILSASTTFQIFKSMCVVKITAFVTSVLFLGFTYLLVNNRKEKEFWRLGAGGGGGDVTGLKAVLVLQIKGVY